MSLKCYKHIGQLVSMNGVHQKDGRNVTQSDLGIIEDGCIVFDTHLIHWVGPTDQLPEKYQSLPSKNLHGVVLTPQIVDAHTHLVFGGNRAFEYSMRLSGADYQQIAAAGGGILSTMQATKNLTFDQLYELGKKRIETICQYGVGAIEIKSGYALEYEAEKLISEVIHKLKLDFAGIVTIHNTFMAAHAIPKQYASSEEYMQQVVLPLLKELAPRRIIDSVDIFHEAGYFSAEDVKALFDLAKDLSIPRRIHADEFNDNNGAALAAQYQCLSCDHLLNTSNMGIAALAKSNTVATLLPGTALFLGKPIAPARAFLDAGCKVALASDYNPGSCHCDNLLMIASISAKQLGMSLAEIWTAICYNSAHALGLNDQGAIVQGMAPRFSAFNCQSLDEITYNWGKNFYCSI